MLKRLIVTALLVAVSGGGTILVWGLLTPHGVGASLTPDPQHGISFSNGCPGMVSIDGPYRCSFTVNNTLNNVNQAHDTLTINSLSEIVHASSGNVGGNILPSLTVTASGGASCDGAPLPSSGHTFCTLPFGGSISTNLFSQYTVVPGDFNINPTTHKLRSDASLAWHDLCDGTDANPTPGGGNCAADPSPTAASGASVVQQLASSTATNIHNASHQVVTTVAVGTTVHDLVTVAGQAGHPNPTGNVSIDWFLNGTCDGLPAANSGSVGPLDANGRYDATAFGFTVNSSGQYAFKAHYLGDPTNPRYAASQGACEPLAASEAVGGIVTLPVSGSGSGSASLPIALVGGATLVAMMGVWFGARRWRVP